MGEEHHWHLISYDIRDPKRWRPVYRLLKGYGESLQYSLIRCRLTSRQLERLRWELSCLLDPEDSLMVVRLCSGCAMRVDVQGSGSEWKGEEEKFKVV